MGGSYERLCSPSNFSVQANYIAPRIVVVGAGAVDHEKFVEQVFARDLFHNSFARWDRAIMVW